MVFERLDSSIVFGPITFTDPDETLTLPISVDSLTGGSERRHAAGPHNSTILQLPPVHYWRPHRRSAAVKKYVVSGFSRTIHKSPPEGGHYVQFGRSGYS